MNVLHPTLAGLLIAASLFAQELKPIPLPKPQTDGGRPLMQVLKDRQSRREFSPGRLSPQMLSNLLWAAWGINRPDGRRTAPSASNRQEIDVYAAVAEGLYLYNAQIHQLEPVVKEDLRAETDAALNVIYVADQTKLGGTSDATNSANTGFIAQNVYLFCASEGLATVVRGSFDRESLAKAMRLRPGQRITMTQAVGYPKK
jgi:nitroreductase